MMQQSQHHTSTCCREEKLQCFCYFLMLFVEHNLLLDENQTSQNIYLLQVAEAEVWSIYDLDSLSASFESTAIRSSSERGRCSDQQCEHPGFLRLSTVKYLCPRWQSHFADHMKWVWCQNRREFKWCGYIVFSFGGSESTWTN